METLGPMLVRAGLLTQDQFLEAVSHTQKTGRSFVFILLEMGYLDEDQLVDFFRRRLMIPEVHPEELMQVPDEVRVLIPSEMARRFQVVPVKLDPEGHLVLAMANPADTHAADELVYFADLYIVRAVARPSAVQQAVNLYYSAPSSPMVKKTQRRPGSQQSHDALQVPAGMPPKTQSPAGPPPVLPIEIAPPPADPNRYQAVKTDAQDDVVLLTKIKRVSPKRRPKLDEPVEQDVVPLLRVKKPIPAKAESGTRPLESFTPTEPALPAALPPQIPSAQNPIAGTKPSMELDIEIEVLPEEGKDRQLAPLDPSVQQKADLFEQKTKDERTRQSTPQKPDLFVSGKTEESRLDLTPTEKSVRTGSTASAIDKSEQKAAVRKPTQPRFQMPSKPSKPSEPVKPAVPKESARPRTAPTRREKASEPVRPSRPSRPLSKPAPMKREMTETPVVLETAKASTPAKQVSKPAPTGRDAAETPLVLEPVSMSSAKPVSKPHIKKKAAIPLSSKPAPTRKEMIETPVVLEPVKAREPAKPAPVKQDMVDTPVVLEQVKMEPTKPALSRAAQKRAEEAFEKAKTRRVIKTLPSKATEVESDEGERIEEKEQAFEKALTPRVVVVEELKERKSSSSEAVKDEPQAKPADEQDEPEPVKVEKRVETAKKVKSEPTPIEATGEKAKPTPAPVVEKAEATGEKAKPAPAPEPAPVKVQVESETEESRKVGWSIPAITDAEKSKVQRKQTLVGIQPRRKAEGTEPKTTQAASKWRSPFVSAASGKRSLSFQVAARSLENSTTRDDVGKVMVDYLNRHCRHSILYVVRQGKLVGREGRGPGLTNESVSKISIPLGEESTVSDVMSSRCPYRGALGIRQGDQDLINKMGYPVEHVVLFPINLRDKVVALLYGDGVTVTLDEAELAALLLLAEQAYEKMILASKQPS